MGSDIHTQLSPKGCLWGIIIIFFFQSDQESGVVPSVEWDILMVYLSRLPLPLVVYSACKVHSLKKTVREKEPIE